MDELQTFRLNEKFKFIKYQDGELSISFDFDRKVLHNSFFPLQYISQIIYMGKLRESVS